MSTRSRNTREIPENSRKKQSKYVTPKISYKSSETVPEGIVCTANSKTFSQEGKPCGGASRTNMGSSESTKK